MDTRDNNISVILVSCSRIWWRGCSFIKKYQIFISSTYEDLKEERKKYRIQFFLCISFLWGWKCSVYFRISLTVIYMVADENGHLWTKLRKLKLLSY